MTKDARAYDRVGRRLFLPLLTMILAGLLRAPVVQAQEEDGESELERAEWWRDTRSGPNDEFPAGQVLAAWNQQRGMTGQGTNHVPWLSVGPAPTSGGQIVGTPLPPARVSGRIHDVAVDPQDPQHWLIASAGGGVWATTNSGGSWHATTDEQPVLSVGAVAFAPGAPNVVYAGLNTVGDTGGFLRSEDGGETWQATSQTFFVDFLFSFRDIVVDPADPDVVEVATFEFFGPSSHTGIFRSTDAGQNWVHTLAGDGVDLEVHPGDFSRQYASIGTIHDESANGLYRSLDSGASWTLVNGPWTGNLSSYQPIRMAIAPSDPDTMVVCIGHSSCYRTSDAWAATPGWTAIANTGRSDDPEPQELLVDRSNPSVFYLASFQNLWRFNGSSWENRTDTTHVDQIALAWSGSSLLLGNDGGIWSSGDDGLSWANHNADLAITQFYEGALDPSDPDVMLGGSQDNGTQRRTTSDVWSFVFGGDGMSCSISPTQPSSRWAFSAQGLWLVRTRDGGATLESADAGIDHGGAPFHTLNVMCPSDDDVFLAGTDNLWRSDDYFSGVTVSWTSNGPEMGQSLSAITFAPSDDSCGTYAFAAGSQLRITTDGGTNWTNLDPSSTLGNNACSVTDLAFDPVDANVIYASCGFSFTAHVFKSTNALAANPTWSAASPPVSISHNAVAVDPLNPSHVYVGTDLGVWNSIDSGATWTPSEPADGMPYVPVLDLRIDEGSRSVVAFTYGRSAFRSSALCGDGVVGVGEQCDDGNLLDGDACSSTCTCDDGNPCTVDSFDGDAGCSYEAIPVDDADCFLAGGAKIKLSDSLPNDKDSLVWLWNKGAAFDQPALGQPDATTTYALCLYDTTGSVPTLAMSIVVQPSSESWRNYDPSGWGYSDGDAASDGARKIRLKPGVAGKSRIKFSAGGVNLLLPGPVDGQSYFDSDPRLVVQMVTNEGSCWSSSFGVSSKNTPSGFKATAP